MGRHPITCWMVILLVATWSDVSLSKKGKGKPGGGGWNTGSNRNPNYPSNPSYPRNPSYPHNPGYPNNPAYPPNPRNPSYPQYPGYPSNPGFGGQPYYPAGGGTNFKNQKPWKPPKTKTNMKAVAGAAAAGAVVGGLGGYALGSAMSGIRMNFAHPDERQWWNDNYNRYPNRVYYKEYGDSSVPSGVFVHDCVNITVTQYNIDPNVNQNVTEVEVKVMKQVIREMCIQQYREYQLASGGKRLLSSSSLLLMIMLVSCFIMH
ncbi:major prion protein homolog [Carettochelys insculpta]|uniref:major prion protein homolog n=1 Tax=Carettochelys insculpta TaxID=44489 RepID=UPI003EB847A9